VFADGGRVDYQCGEDVVQQEEDCVGCEKGFGNDDTADCTLFSCAWRGRETYRLEFVPSIVLLLFPGSARHIP